MAYFKKAGGKIYGVEFSAKEKKAMDKEILRQCAEIDRKNVNEMDALILWLLHEKLGFGKKRLRRFYDWFHTEFEALMKRYELDEEDTVWLCTKKLLDYGIDISEWNKEVMK